MENAITPEQVRRVAARAHLTINRFLRNADVGVSTFYRWEAGEVKDIHPVTRQRLEDAMAKAETARENAA